MYMYIHNHTDVHVSASHVNIYVHVHCIHTCTCMYTCMYYITESTDPARNDFWEPAGGLPMNNTYMYYMYRTLILCTYNYSTKCTFAQG